MKRALLVCFAVLCQYIFTSKWLFSGWTSPTPPQPVAELQPDKVRTAVAAPAPESREMRCGEAIAGSSISMTEGVEIFVQSFFKGQQTDSWVWQYQVEMHNTNAHPVQMLTRHWMFVDANARLEEVKGPGARGATPVIAPGDRWKYESGTTLPTQFGSMLGSFQFDHIRQTGRSGFSATVARLALSPNREAVVAPCAPPSAEHLVPSTSVWVTEQIIAGLTVEYSPELSKPERNVFHFTYDVQINNVAEHSVVIEWHSWQVTEHSSDGPKRLMPIKGKGLGGYHELGPRNLEPSNAVRYRGGVELSTREGMIEGQYGVKDVNGHTLLVKVARAGLSLDGSSVSSLE